MTYPAGSIERGLLESDPEALGRVYRWISVVLASPRFWSIRPLWPDLVQEAVTRVLESLRAERFDASRSFQLYVQGVARYTALQALVRETGSRSSVLATRAQGEWDGTEERLASLQLVRRALDLATEECRLLFRAYFFEEKNYAEIAAAMSVPAGTVKSRLFRCLEAAHRVVFRALRRPAPALPPR